MGICDSSHNNKMEYSSSEYEKDYKQFKKLESSDLEKNSPKKINSSSSISKNISMQNIKLNTCPQLEKYKPSFEKKSEVSYMIPTRSEYSSKITEEEIIIKGEINKECQNKEKDFNNNSFKRLIKNNGGIILKEDGQSNTQSNIINDISKENISEINSQFSFGTNNYRKFLINGKNNKNKLPSEEDISKMSYRSLRLRKIENIKNTDNKSFYSTKTFKNKINLNNYLNSVFTNNDILINNKIQYINNNIYNTNQRNPINAFYNKYNNNNIIHNNVYLTEKESLLSNVNNLTNESTNEELMGSFISIPKNDERIPESDLCFGKNGEDIVSSLSSHE